MDRHERLISAAVLAVGILLAGWLIGRGLMAWRTADRYVTVKGFSEREVKADTALWPIRFVSTNDNLGRAQGDIKKSKDIILSFLEKHGMDPKTVEIHKFEVTDILANPYRGTGTVQSRYIISQTLMVRSKDPSRVMAASPAHDPPRARAGPGSAPRPASMPRREPCPGRLSCGLACVEAPGRGCRNHGTGQGGAPVRHLGGSPCPPPEPRRRVPRYRWWPL